MVFDRNEFVRRLTRCRDAMAKRGIDVLVDSDPANMNYLTGYDGWSFYVPQAVIVTLDDDEPLWIGRGVDIGGARLTTYLSDGSIIEWPDHLVDNPDEHPMDFIGAVLAERGHGNAAIGIERDCYYFTPRCRDALMAALPNATFVDTDRLVNWVRLVKSDAEIEVMAQAARVTEGIMAAYFDAVEPGVRECDVIAKVYGAQAGGTAQFGGDYCCVAPMMPTGTGTSAAHLTWSDRRFVKDEAAFLETAGVRHRYHVPMVRTLHLGAPPQRLLDTCKAVVEGIDEAIAAARPGGRCEDVEAAWRRTITRHGVTKKSRIGYSIGIGYPPDWGEHTASLRSGDETVLEENMTFHVVCGIWKDDWGLNISEPIRIAKTGGVRFADVPRDLLVKT
ncbi:MAG: M24 family metallopeptidase [Pseudomonadota bacterium]